jgi:hypothetical protein
VSGSGLQPTLTVPGDVIVPATPRPLVRVNYFPAVSGSEPGGTVTVSCAAPAPATTTATHGSFPVGTTTVTCTATDQVGNAVTGQFHVQVLGASDFMADLITSIDGLGGPAIPLLTPAQSAQAALAANDVTGACTDLDQLVTQVAAISGKHKPLTTAEGNALKRQAVKIEKLLAC